MTDATPSLFDVLSERLHGRDLAREFASIVWSLRTEHADEIVDVILHAVGEAVGAVIPAEGA